MKVTGTRPARSNTQRSGEVAPLLDVDGQVREGDVILAGSKDRHAICRYAPSSIVVE